MLTKVFSRLILFLSLCVFLSANLQAEDRILEFTSDIEVKTDGKIVVKETITIFNDFDENGNNEIKRGIYRDFPTLYTDKYGLLYSVPFKLISLTRNGEYESHKTERLDNGIRIYTGQEHIFLDRGNHTYEIIYETGRQIIFHDDKDEFYWNVTGNGWSFFVDKASCTIRFPEGAEIIESACYTGFTGSRDADCHFQRSDSDTITFKTLNQLSPEQGLTVAASIRKGVIIKQVKAAAYFALLKDNAFIPILFVLVLLHFIVLFRYWKKVGKDPQRGVIIPQFEPPADMSPADVGFTYSQQYKPVLFAASIVDHAVKRKLDIEVSKEGVLFKNNVYTFKKPDFIRNSSRDEKLYEWYGYDIEDLYNQKAETGSYNSTLDKLDSSLQRRLKERILVEKGKSNRFKNILSLNDNYIGIGIFFLFFLFLGVIINLSIRSSWLHAVIGISLLVAAIVSQAVFMKIIKAYTPEGMAIRDHIDGFRMYLKTAEEKMFNMLNPPEMTLQLFEKYLPYAIALECENEWAGKFETIIQQALDRGETPAYYRSNIANSFNAAAFSSGISSGLSSTVSSASTPPSKSGGGSSGGGSSGGGGGGGGGGGW